MNDRKSPTYYLIAAIIWTLVALFALYVVMFRTEVATFGKGCALVLIAMCLVGQWMRYAKMR